MAIDFGHKVNIEDEVHKAAETERRKRTAFLNTIGGEFMTIFEGFGIEVEDVRYTAL